MTLDQKLLKKQLARAVCYKCGNKLEGAEIFPISTAAETVIAHAVCPKCQAESMVAITTQGSNLIPLMTDLSKEEFSKFSDLKPIGYEDIFGLHKDLTKEPIWKLLLKKENKLAKKPSR